MRLANIFLQWYETYNSHPHLYNLLNLNISLIFLANNFGIIFVQSTLFYFTNIFDVKKFQISYKWMGIYRVLVLDLIRIINNSILIVRFKFEPLGFVLPFKSD